MIKKLLEANIDESNWTNTHPDEALKAFNVELNKLTGKTIPEDEFKDGFSGLTLTWDPLKYSLFKSADDAYKAGFFDKNPDLSGIYDLRILNEVLKQKSLPTIG